MAGVYPPPLVNGQAPWLGINATNAAAAKALAARSAGMNAQYGVGMKNFANGSLTVPSRARINSALSNAGIGNINWAKIFGASSSKKGPAVGIDQTVNPNGPAANVAPSGSVPSVPGDYGSLFQNVLQQALSLYNTPNNAANSLIHPNAILAGLSGSEINPNQVGQDAGLGYDAQIGQLQRNLGTTQNQNAQNLADIKNWFAQAANTQKAGAAQNAKDFATQLAGSQDAAQAFMNALGGNASPAAAGIANASDIANAALRGENLANTNYDNNMAGVVALDQAQQLQNEQTAGTNRLQTLMDQMAQLTGQKTAAQAQAKDNAQQTLFGQKSSLANMKANLVGNLFNEKQGLRQQKLAELGGLSNTILGTALAPSQIQAANIANQGAAATVAARKISNIGLMKQVNSLGAVGARDITQANPGTRQSIQQSVESRFLGPNGGLKTNPAAIPGLIANYLKGTLGLQDGAALQAFAKAIYTDLVTPARVAVYNKQHGKK